MCRVVLALRGDVVACSRGRFSEIDPGAAKPPTPPVTVGFAGRLLTDRGVPTLVAAHDLLARRGRPVELLIAGEPDPANPASIPKTTLAEWKKRRGLTLLGHLDDIRTLWAKAHIAVLASLREGLPVSLLEAAACARPDRGQTTTLCWYLRTMLPRWPMPSTGLPAMRICVGASARPAAPWSNANSPTSGSAVRSLRSTTGCSRQRNNNRDLPGRQYACGPSTGEPMLNIVALSLVFVGSALASAGLIWLLQPLWQRYALAKPNSRSSHKVPTPQSGGIVVIAVTVTIVALATAFMPGMAADNWRLAVVLTGAVALAIVGAIDDLHMLEAVGAMQRANRVFEVFFRNEHADLDLGRRNKPDIDPLLPQRLEEPRRNAGVRAHAGADDG